MYVCTNCKQGLMDPVRDEEEPEYTDRYQCGHCGHVSTIPSLLIIAMQFVSSIAGGGVAVYLMMDHLMYALSAWQLGEKAGIASHLALVLAALVFVAGFGYTLFRATRDYQRRAAYLPS